MHLYYLVVHFTNGSDERLPFNQYSAVRDYYQHSISYSGNRVKRVEVLDHYGSLRAIWDASWDAISKAKGLQS